MATPRAHITEREDEVVCESLLHRHIEILGIGGLEVLALPDEARYHKEGREPFVDRVGEPCLKRVAVVLTGGPSGAGRRYEVVVEQEWIVSTQVDRATSRLLALIEETVAAP